MRDRITRKQRRFVEEYMVDLDSKAAAIRAGFPGKHAWRLLTDRNRRPLVVAAISQAMSERAKRMAVRADDVLVEVKRIALADPLKAFDAHGCLLPFEKIPEDVRRIIASVDVQEIFEGKGEERCKIGEVKKIKFWDKGAALDKLMKHLDLYKDKQRVEVTGAVTLQELLAPTAVAELEEAEAPEPENFDSDDPEDDEVFT